MCYATVTIILTLIEITNDELIKGPQNEFCLIDKDL